MFLKLKRYFIIEFLSAFLILGQSWATESTSKKSNEIDGIAAKTTSENSKILLKDDNEFYDWAKMEAQDLKYQETWLNQQTVFTNYNTPVDVQRVTTALGNLGIDERPLAVGQRSYIKSPTGETQFASYKHQPETLQVRDYGLSPTRVSYIATEGQRYRETFTPTLRKGKTFKGNRKHPFHAFSLTLGGEKIDFDAGHGIDQADTVVANGRNSSTDPLNFVPQNRFYNQKIRNHIVNHETRNHSEGSYREISVYDESSPTQHTLSNGQICQIPIGFIFVIFRNHQVARTFYFPNLISYEKLTQEQGIEPGYRNYMKYFEISRETVVNNAVEVGDTDQHLRAENDHSYKGHRSLSGEYDVVGHIEMPNSAKAALRRLLAVYHIEQAAHLEFCSVAEKAALVGTYTSKMKYYALDKADEKEEKERDKAYWQAYKDEEKKLIADHPEFGEKFDLADYAIKGKNFFLRLRGNLPADDPREMALKRVQEIHNKLEKGQDLYNPERAKLWLSRIEKAVQDMPNVEDIIRLLELYDIPEVENRDKKRSLEVLLETHGQKASFEEQKMVGDYFFYQLSNENREAEKKSIQAKVDAWKAIFEKRLEKSTSVSEITRAADWYHAGSGILSENITKARKLYKLLLPHVKKDEKQRINYCLEKLDKIEAYRKAQTKGRLKQA